MIHKTAIVDKNAKVHSSVSVGPFSVIGPNVEIGENVVIHSHVNITGNTIIGSGNKFYPFASIGNDPQDLKYNGEDTKLIIGNNNLLMAYTHIGHNCELGNRIVLSNSVQVAGHVKIEEKAIIGGCLGIHQFVHIGYLAMIGGMTRVDRDVPPFCLAEGHPGRLRGLNRIGIKRSGLMENKDFDFKLLQSTWNLLFKSSDAITNSLEKAMKGELDLSSSKLCSFLKESISKERRGPMPVVNL